MIEGKNLGIGFGSVTAVKELNFTVPTGEIYGLIGVNGAGKTSLLKLLAGIYGPDSGQCLYDGSPIYDNPQIIEKVAYVANGNNYMAGFTAEGMLRFYETMFTGFDKESFKKQNEVLDIPLHVRMSSLSYGQRIRMQFMLSLARHPKYLLLDEPIANLDPLAQEAFLQMLVEEVEERGMTVLLASHQIQVLESICDGVFFMREGSLFLQGNVTAIRERYAKISFVWEESSLPFADSDDTVSYNHTGSLYTGIFAASPQESMEKLRGMGAKECKAEDMMLQELFVALSHGRRHGMLRML